MDEQRAAGRAWQVGPYLLDERRFEIRRDGVPVEVQRHVLDLLFFLLRSEGRLITERDLIRGPWRGAAVTPAALRRAIMLARRALEGAAEGETLIATVRGKGFKFVGRFQEVPVRESEPPPSGERSAALRSAVSRPARGSAPADGPRHASLIGREAELGRLRDLGHRAQAGEGGIALLLGPPGIGKTLLIEHFASWAKQEGMRVVWGRAWEAGGAPPFWPWMEVIEQLLPRDGARGAELDQAVHDIGTLLSDSPSGAAERGAEAAHDSARTRFRMFGSMARILDHAAGEAPLLVLLEDLHFADDASLLMLRFRSRGLPFASRLLIVATCRDSAMSPATAEGERAALHDLLFGDPGRMERLALRGLALGEFERLVNGLVSAPLSPPAVADVHEVTEGNPLLVEELARTGALQTFGRSELAKLQPLPIPERIGRAIRAHLDRLAPDTLDTLAYAAVMGREFQVSLLAALSGLPPAEVISRLERAMGSAVIEELRGGPGWYRFRHTLIRETIYQGLPSSRRHEDHARLAEHLERGSSEDHRLVSQLAYHYAAAVPCGDPGKAVRFGLEAAQQARHLLAYELSAQHFRRVLGLLGASVCPDGRQRRAVLMALAEVEALSTRPAEALAALEEAMTISRALEDPDGFAEAVLACFDLAREVAILLPTFHLGVKEALAARTGDDRFRARLLAVNAFIGHFTTPFEERVAEAEAALSMARRLADEDTLRAVLRFSHFSMLHPSQTVRTLALARALADRSRRAHSAVGEMDGLHWEAQHALTLGDGELFSRASGAHASLAQAIKHPTHLWYARLLDCARLFQSGQLDRTEASLRATQSWAVQAVGSTAADSTAGGQLLMLAWQTTEDAPRRRLLVEARGLGQRVVDAAPVFAVWRLALEVIDWELGEGPLVPWKASKVAEWLSSIPEDAHLLFCLALLGHVTTTARDDGDTLRAILERLTPYADLHVAVSSLDWGPVLFHMGKLTEALGDLVEAQRCYEGALARSRQARSRPWEQQAERALSRIRGLHPRTPRMRVL